MSNATIAPTLPPAPDLPRLLTSAQLAQRLGIHERTVGNWIRVGLLPRPLKIGRLVRHDLDRVREALAKLAGGVADAV